ncbi:MAG: hypothetical protein AB7Q76_03585 [Gammaproteobacteria bacterium]
MPSLDRPLVFVPRVSRGAVAGCVVLHAAAGAGVLWQWPWSPGLAAALALIAWAGVACSAELAWLPRRYTQVTWTADGSWELRDAQGSRDRGVLSGNAVIAPAFVLVPLRIHGRRRLLMATAGTTAPEVLRRLRLRSRFARTARATACAAE